eukprot:2926212-Pyramimonas_sp.AAC.1
MIRDTSHKADDKEWFIALSYCREALRPITSNITQKDWDRRPASNDVRMGDFIIIKNWGSTKCFHYDNHYPKGNHNTKIPLAKGHIYGPIIHFGVFDKFFAVQIPIFNYGLRW